MQLFLVSSTPMKIDGCYLCGQNLAKCHETHIYMLNSFENPKMVVTMTTHDLETIVKQAAQAAVNEAFEQYRNSIEEKSAAPEEQYFTRKDVVEMFHINETTLWRWTKDGKLPCVKMGSRVMYCRSVVEQFVSEHKRKTAASDL